MIEESEPPPQDDEIPDIVDDTPPAGEYRLSTRRPGVVGGPS